MDTKEPQCVPMDVGVRELKRRLSELLERAARGEVIRVTDRGHPKAILGPLPGVEQRVRLAAESAPIRVTRQRARRRISEVVDEDRGT